MGNICWTLLSDHKYAGMQREREREIIALPACPLLCMHWSTETAAAELQNLTWGQYLGWPRLACPTSLFISSWKFLRINGLVSLYNYYNFLTSPYNLNTLVNQQKYLNIACSKTEMWVTQHFTTVRQFLHFEEYFLFEWLAGLAA